MTRVRVSVTAEDIRIGDETAEGCALARAMTRALLRPVEVYSTDWRDVRSDEYQALPPRARWIRDGIDGGWWTKPFSFTVEVP